MNAVDTDVVVRLLTGDEPAQAAKARAVFDSELIFVPETVVLEAEWVLRHAYGFKPRALLDAFTSLFGLKNVVLQEPRRMQTALGWYAEGMDFADALHLASCQGCPSFYTFDRKLIRKSAGRGKCRVRGL